MFNVRILFRVQNYGEKSVFIPISVVFLVEDAPESPHRSLTPSPSAEDLPPEAVSKYKLTIILSFR